MFMDVQGGGGVQGVRTPPFASKKTFFRVFYGNVLAQDHPLPGKLPFLQSVDLNLPPFKK